ncbi:MAG TPA: hypothetical protein VMR17_13415 [Xanthobacteraceae bacterium]|jgi:hypothetical protein|nr:hypothetical protein [Xanthobacteraceae bacterium]
MQIIRFVGRLALPAGVLFFYGLAGAGAQGVDVRQACTPDAMRLCSEFIPDEAKITSCMMAKRALLSPECRLAMAGGGKVQRAAVRHVYHVRHHHG